MKILFNRRVIVNAWVVAIRQTLTAMLARLLKFILTFFIRRDPELTVVINRPGTSFADNSKYFFVHATDLAEKGERFVMLTAEASTRKMIVDAGGDSVLHPTFQSFYLLLRCGKVVTDMDWYNFGAYPLTIGAKLIQLWHGAPLKHIEFNLNQCQDKPKKKNLS